MTAFGDSLLSVAEDTGSASDFAPVITLTTISDQDDLSAMTVALNPPTIGGVTKTPSAVAFTVNGATTGLADPTDTGGTTFTPTRGGEYTFGGTVTIDGVVYPITPQTRTVGRPGNLYATHLRDWRDETTTLTDAVASTGGDGIDVTPTIKAGVTLAAAETSRGLVVDGSGQSVGGSNWLEIAAAAVRDSLAQRTVIYLVLGSDPTGTATTAVQILYVDADASHAVAIRIYDDPGDRIEMRVNPGTTFTNSTAKTPAGPVRVIALELCGASARVYYSTSTAGTIPNLSDMTLLANEPGDATTGIFTLDTVAPTADAIGYALASDKIRFLFGAGQSVDVLQTAVFVGPAV